MVSLTNLIEGGNMKRIVITILIGISLAACVAVPTGRHGHGGGVMVVPLLPSIVVLGAEPYYFQDGYHYHYNNGRWFYARSRSGPWVDLPRDHYPKEVRFKERDRDHDRDHDRDRDRDRSYDNQWRR